MSEELTVSKIRLRLSYDSSGVNAEMITPTSEPVHEATDTTPNSAPKMTKKKKKANTKRHDETQINNAEADMKQGMNTKSAAMKWGVPRTTLQNRKKAGFKSVTRPGPPIILTSDEEKALCDWLIELSRRGIPVQKKFLLDSIQQILIAEPRPTPFVNNRPGKGWFHAFLRRHPNLAERYAEPICRGRGQLTENCIRGWFSDAEKFFEEKNCQYVMHDSTKQYNGDETGFQLDPRSGRVLAPRNENVYTEAGGTKEQLTALITTRADGKLMPTAVVYPYKRGIPANIVNQFPEDWVIARSDSGWMTSEIFYEYLANCFIPKLNDMRRQEKKLVPSEPLVLTEADWIVYWIDGYSSHLTLHASKLCELNHIHLYCFKAHASHICQPNDVGPFKPLKMEWKQAVGEWRLTHPYQALTRQEFAPLLAKTVDKLNAEAIISGYKATGLCPWNADAVHYNHLTTKRQQLEIPFASSTAVTSSQLCQDAESQKPKLIIEPGPNTSGYTVAFRHDECNNIVITHIIPQLDNASASVGVTDHAAVTIINSELPCVNEVLAGEDLNTSQPHLIDDSELTQYVLQVLSTSSLQNSQTDILINEPLELGTEADEAGGLDQINGVTLPAILSKKNLQTAVKINDSDWSMEEICGNLSEVSATGSVHTVSYTHLRAHETGRKSRMPSSA